MGRLVSPPLLTKPVGDDLVLRAGKLVSRGKTGSRRFWEGDKWGKAEEGWPMLPGAAPGTPAGDWGTAKASPEAVLAETL